MEEVFFQVVFVCTQMSYHMARTMVIVTTALHTMHLPALLLIQSSREKMQGLSHREHECCQTQSQGEANALQMLSLKLKSNFCFGIQE